MTGPNEKRKDSMAGRKRRRRLINRKAEIILHIVLAAALVVAAAVFIIRAALRPESVPQGEPAGQVPAASAVTVSLPDPAEEAAESAVSSDVSAVEPIADPMNDNSPPSEVAKIRQVPEDEIVETDISGDWRLILVNPSHRLPDEFLADTCAIWEEKPELQIDWRVYDALHAMLYDCGQAGHKLTIRSAYRTRSQQEDLFETKYGQFIAEGETPKEARENAATIIALPGTSEHELGLAVDLVGSEYGVLNEAQEDTPEQKWLMEHCWEYGFILRYPTDKGGITGIIYEPWHYRYVGKDAARIMHEQNLCLEEYLYEFGSGGKSGAGNGDEDDGGEDDDGGGYDDEEDYDEEDYDEEDYDEEGDYGDGE